MSKQAKDKLIEHYEKELERMFSDKDFERYFGGGKVIKYSELDNYATINDLLPKDKDFRIILVESQYNQGHWVAVLKYGNIIEWFNSYGTKPEYDFKFIPTFTKHLLGQGGNLLTKLLKTKNKGQKVYYNKKKFQKIIDGINTCGRWCVARILAMRCGYELDDFINKVDEKVEETGKPSDILVIDWIV
jgi:hypothetical protein